MNLVLDLFTAPSAGSGRLPLEQRAGGPHAPKVTRLPRHAQIGDVRRGPDRAAELPQHPTGGCDELFRVDGQPFQQYWCVTGNEAALVLAEHPTGGIHQF